MKYNNNQQLRDYLRKIRKMNPEQKQAFESILKEVENMEREAKSKNITDRQFTKALFIVDMNNGFVNFGAMANNDYNALVPGQRELIERFRRDKQLVNFIMEGHIKEAAEFLLYPEHCVFGTEESELIPEFKEEENKDNTNIYYKNSINGSLNLDLQIDLEDLKDLKEIVIAGVCTDLCVLDFARTLARYMDEINRSVKIFVVRSLCDTFGGPDHDHDEETEIAYHIMSAAGIEVVDDLDALAKREKELKLVA